MNNSRHKYHVLTRQCFIGKFYFCLYSHAFYQILSNIFCFCPDNVAKNFLPDDSLYDFGLYDFLPNDNENNSQGTFVLLLN